MSRSANTVAQRTKNAEPLTLRSCVEQFATPAERETYVRDWSPHMRLSFVQNQNTARHVYPSNLDLELRIALARVEQLPNFASIGSVEQLLEQVDILKSDFDGRISNDLPPSLEIASNLNDEFEFPRDSALYEDVRAIDRAAGVLRSMMDNMESEYRKVRLRNQANEVRLQKLIRQNYVLERFVEQFDLAQDTLHG